MITLLTSGQRGQTVHLMSLNGMQMLQDRCRFHIIEHTKTSKPGSSAPTIMIKQYPANEKINPLRCGENKLFISFQRPYKAVTRQTISWWLKVVMYDAGVDTKRFQPHLIVRAVPLDIIISTAGCQRAATFKRFYNIINLLLWQIVRLIWRMCCCLQCNAKTKFVVCKFWFTYY